PQVGISLAPCPNFRDHLRSSLEADRVAAATAKLALLSARERDVLKGLIEGLSNKVIAYQLEISPRTVEIYRAKLMEKLEVRSLSEALGIAFAAGMFPRH
ncbi:MAG: LuxR C-terminal-related transcriptional regulator, partial [Sphingomonas sp.]